MFANLHQRGKPKFQLVSDCSWASVTKLLKDFLPNYLRCILEPSKEKLMADRFLPEINKYFPALGLSVFQDESFYIDFKK